MCIRDRLDTELLSKVYIELLDKKEPTLNLSIDKNSSEDEIAFDIIKFNKRKLPRRLSEEEKNLHDDFIESLGPKAVWKKINLN